MLIKLACTFKIYFMLQLSLSKNPLLSRLHSFAIPFQRWRQAQSEVWTLPVLCHCETTAYLSLSYFSLFYRFCSPIILFTLFIASRFLL